MPPPPPTATPTPTPAPDDRFGIIAVGAGRDWRVQELGVKYFIDYTADPRDAPAGTVKAPFVAAGPGRTRLTPEQIAAYTSAPENKGLAWYIGGEPNVVAQGNISPAAYVDELDYYAETIKAADPTAKIMSASILNWDFTCTGCGGYTSGHQWMQQFVDAYAVAHPGKVIPVDIWAIDAYPLTWVATPDFPTPLPMTHWELVRDQILGLRGFLQQLPGHGDTPIWVTEVASHWAFDGLGWTPPGCGPAPATPCKLTIPAGQDWDTDYRWDDMVAYIDNLAGWLKSNGPAQRIERWFFFRAYAPIRTMAAEGYAGLNFFESADVGAPLNRLGEVYRDYAAGRR